MRRGGPLTLPCNLTCNYLPVIFLPTAKIVRSSVLVFGRFGPPNSQTVGCCNKVLPSTFCGPRHESQSRCYELLWSSLGSYPKPLAINHGFHDSVSSAIRGTRRQLLVDAADDKPSQSARSPRPSPRPNQRPTPCNSPPSRRELNT